MPNSLLKAGKELLCLYAFYGDITEAKLSFLRGRRAYQEFLDYALEFVFNLSVKEFKPEDKNEIYGNFFDYMRILQVNYHDELKKRHFTSDNYLFDLESEGITWKHLRDGHRVLCSLDGTQADDARIEELLQQCDFGWELENHRKLARGLLCAREAFTQLRDFEVLCSQHHISVFHNMKQTVSEFGMFLTHVARGFRYRLEGQTEQGIREGDASISHLKRVTLDMRKSVILTAKQHRPDLFDSKMLSTLLLCRQKEQRMPVEDGNKFELYKDEAATVLSLNIFS